MGSVSSGKQIDLERLGGVLVTTTAMILAIRTERREPTFNRRDSNRDWDAEMNFALNVASALLTRATCEHAELFRQIVVEYTEGVVADDEMR